VLSGDKVVSAQKTNHYMTDSDYRRHLTAVAGLPNGTEPSALTNTSSPQPITAEVVSTATTPDGSNAYALLKTAENQYVFHKDPKYTYATTGDQVRASADPTHDPVQITRPAKPELNEQNNTAAEKYWLQQAQQHATTTQSPSTYLHQNSHDVTRGTVVLSETDALTKKTYTVIENKNGLYLKTHDSPLEPKPKRGESVALTPSGVARDTEAAALTTKNERISAAIAAASGDSRAPRHRLEKPNTEAAGKVIAAANHPVKPGTGYAVIEADYGNGKKAYFYHEHTRYSDAAEKPIRPGDNVYVNTSTQPEPKKIKQQYVKTLNEDRTPEPPLSREHLQKQEAERKKSEGYSSGRGGRTIT
jgi:hypothetical protein